MAKDAKRWRNGEHGYGIVSKSLHWVIAALLVAQFAVGLTMDADDGSGRGRGRGRGGESGRGRGRGGDDGYDVFADDSSLSVHVVLGVTIIGLVLVRLLWRTATPLPPWAAVLAAHERTFVHWNERAMYAFMLAVPVTGLLLVGAGDDDVLVFHIAAQIGLLVVIALHLGIVLRHQFGLRDGYARRMFGG